MSLELLDRAAKALAPVLGDVVFLGGASLVLWITDAASPTPRPTKDVDVVVEVTSRTAFHDFEQRLRSLGFREDQEDDVICRWRHRDPDLILDAMPSDAAIIGFENRWQGASIPHALKRVLPSGAQIRATPPAYLLATKAEAFNSRGGEDFLGSRDFGDIIALIDGREELVAEVLQAGQDLRAYLSSELRRLGEHPRFARGYLELSQPTSQARRAPRRSCCRASDGSSVRSLRRTASVSQPDPFAPLTQTIAASSRPASTSDR